jgi:hypothetical protein
MVLTFERAAARVLAATRSSDASKTQSVLIGS